MMRWLVGNSLRFRFIVIGLATAMVFFGADRLRQMPVDVFPEFAPPRVEIQTPCLGLTPEEVEDLITVPMEQALSGLDGLDVMRSKSVEQLSSVQLIFKPGTNELRARQLAQERVDIVTPTIPSWATPPVMLPPLSATSRTMKIGISSKTLSTIQLSMIAYWKIRQALLAVPGVANVPIWGERIQMMAVLVDPARLKAHGVTVEQVMETTADTMDSGLIKHSKGAVVGTGGFIDTPNQRLPIRHVLPVVTPADLAEVPVKERRGKPPLLLGDVADVREEHQPLVGDAIINDDVGLLLIVEKYPWANTMDVTRGVEKALDTIRPGLPGVDIDSTIFRPATFIELSIHNLSHAFMIGCALVIAVLIAFLYEWRVAVISIVSIPLSLIAAAIVLYWLGATINTMVLAGFVIALGSVVDDAIIDVENIVRRLRQHRLADSKKSTARVILAASLEVRPAILHATLIAVAALIPVFFMKGLSGAFFKPLAGTYVLALLASMLVAMTVTAALALIMLKNAPLERRHSPLVKWCQGGYTVLLSRVLRAPVIAYAALGALALAGILVAPHLGQSLLPSFKERDFLMHWVTKPGTSLAEMDRITIAASKELRTIPGVRNFGAHIGQALIMDEVVGVNFGENWISIDPQVDYAKTAASIQHMVDGYPGLYRDVQTYLKERIREVLTGAHEAVTVRIFGPDLKVLGDTAKRVETALKGTRGLKELHVALQTDMPQIEVKLDLAKARQYGLKPGDVRRAAGVLVAGDEVGDIFRGGKAYDVYVWGVPGVRRSVTDVENLMLDTPDGRQVRLADMATVRVVSTPNIIRRENMERNIDVGANLDGTRDLGSVADEVEDRLDKVAFPLGYYPVVLGENAEREAVQERLHAFMIAATVVIFLLLHAAFKNWKLAVIAFVAFPTALVGGVLAAYMGDKTVSLGSLVGFLTVLGIATRNGIMMISHFQHLERFEREAFGVELVMRGASERLAPVLMTALAAGLALLPLVIAGNIAGHEIEYPMAVVILGGLITSTLLNLFVIPALYLRFGTGTVEPLEKPVAANGSKRGQTS
jgi:CzcA family heavy metal efflux pump